MWTGVATVGAKSSAFFLWIQGISRTDDIYVLCAEFFVECGVQNLVYLNSEPVF